MLRGDVQLFRLVFTASLVISAFSKCPRSVVASVAFEGVRVELLVCLRCKLKCDSCCEGLCDLDCGATFMRVVKQCGDVHVPMGARETVLSHIGGTSCNPKHDPSQYRG
eukprot:921257-Amphidinium_carterae.1